MIHDMYLLRQFLLHFCSDSRIKVSHIAMVFAFVQLADKGLDRPIYISRKLVMKHARIRSIVTYHKFLKELQAYGYVYYVPSYHPGIRSFIQLLWNSKIP